MTTNETKLWCFTSKVDPDRAGRLLKEFRFEELVEEIRNEMVLKSFKAQPATNPDLAGCYRPEFILAVSPLTFDRFFNSPWGYRGQYYQSPQLGVRANRLAIDEILSTLLQYAKNCPRSDMSLTEIRRSLQLPSSKIWIHEEDLNLDARRIEEFISIENVDWIKQAQCIQGHVINGIPLSEDQKNGKYGVLAPRGTMLEIKGAWLDKDGGEYVEERKVRRAECIHEYGFS